MNEIKGDAKSIRALLGGAKYSVDYYQREYRWETKQIVELLADLSGKFLEDYDEGDERSAVAGYGHYFLGSIIISHRDNQKFIIDGQQRLTSITLLLMHLHKLLGDEEQKKQLVDLIFSSKYGRRSFNLDVPERTQCLEALYLGQAVDETNQPESVRNILARYRDIVENFPAEIKGDGLAYFTDWLIENVHLVEITAYSDEDAYTIFETMNDRGLSLNSTEMLKGYLLANIRDVKQRETASETWKSRIRLLQDLGKEADADAITSWLRSQYAESIRERKKGGVPRDFDLIGTQFHRWVKDNEERLGLDRPSGFFNFIQKDFEFYSRQYHGIRRAAENLTPGLEAVYYNGRSEFTLQYPVILSALRATDSDFEIRAKIRIVSKYLDILLTRRIWHWRAVDYNQMTYPMYVIMKELRGKTAAQIARILKDKLDAEQEKFADNEIFGLTGINGRQIHRILARMTDFIETGSGQSSRYAEYIQRKGKHGYEVEHIWANHPDRHVDEFPLSTDFDATRNRIGGLLLLPKSFNASYGDLEYAQKREHYFGQNLLAASLHERAYERNPGFRRFIEATELPFRPISAFKKAQMEERTRLYCQLAERIWDSSLLLDEVDANHE
jgi:hypothetical protein